MSQTTATQAPVSTAEEVVSAEVKVCNQDGRSGSCTTDTTAADATAADTTAMDMAAEMYKNITMGCDAYLQVLARTEDSRIKTDITAALCYYEKLAGKVKQFITDHGGEPQEEGMMAKLSARAGIAMNAMKDNTDSHLAEMLIEGCTMSVTTAEKLAKHGADHPACADLAGLCRDWARFEQNHINALKQYL